MGSAGLNVGAVKAAALEGSAAQRGPATWTLEDLRGRLVEVAGWRGGAVYSAAALLVLDAQRGGEPCAWVGPRWRGFFPADFDALGVDLDALAIVRVADADELSRGADILARSGGFGLIVLDLGALTPPLSTLSRFAGLARAHGTAIVFLTEKPPSAPSLGSFVSLRADAQFARATGGAFDLCIQVDRDRQRVRGWQHREVRLGPPGLP